MTGLDVAGAFAQIAISGFGGKIDLVDVTVTGARRGDFADAAHHRLVIPFVG